MQLPSGRVIKHGMWNTSFGQKRRSSWLTDSGSNSKKGKNEEICWRLHVMWHCHHCITIMRKPTTSVKGLFHPISNLPALLKSCYQTYSKLSSTRDGCPGRDDDHLQYPPAAKPLRLYEGDHMSRCSGMLSVLLTLSSLFNLANRSKTKERKPEQMANQVEKIW